MTSSDAPYRLETTDSYSIITILPELNDSQWADFEKVGTHLTEHVAARKSPKFVVDLSPLNYMGSAMVALIVRLWKTANEKDGKMAVVNNDPMVFEVLKLAGLHKVWTIVDTREEAVKTLGKRLKPMQAEGSGGAAPAGDDSMTTPLIAAAGMVVAIVGVGLALSGSSILPTKTAYLIGLAGAIAGLIAGSMGAAKAVGGAKSLSILAVAVSALLLLAGIMKMPEANSANAPDTKQPETDLGTSSDVPPTDDNEGAAASGEKEATPAKKDATKKDAAKKKNSGRRGDDEEEGEKPAAKENKATKKPAAKEEKPAAEEKAEPAKEEPASTEEANKEAAKSEPEAKPETKEETNDSEEKSE